MFVNINTAFFLVVALVLFVFYERRYRVESWLGPPVARGSLVGF